MKKEPLLALLLLLGLALPSGVHAQFTVGAYGMLNSADLNGDTPEDFSYGGSTGFGFGLIGELHLTDDIWLSVQPGIHPKGAGLELEVEDEEEPVKVGSIDLSYVSIPILAKFVTVGGKVYVISGVNLGFLTSAEIELEEGDGEPVEVKDSMRSFDLAVDFGVGGQLPVGSVKIMLEARYEQGLLNIVEDNITEAALQSRVRSSGLQLLAGILLPLGGGR